MGKDNGYIVPVIGSAVFHGFDRFEAVLKGEIGEQTEKTKFGTTEKSPAFYSELDFTAFRATHPEFTQNIDDPARFVETFFFQKGKGIAKLRQINDFVTEFGQNYDVIYSEEPYTVIRFARQYFVVPTEELSITLLSDYSDKPFSEIKAMLSGKGEKPTETTLAALKDESVSSSLSKLEKIPNEMEALAAKEKAIMEGKTKELEAAQMELERMQSLLNEKKEAALAALTEKKNEMKALEKDLKGQIFLIETEISALRGYLFETVNFAEIRKGRKEPEETPVVFYQKVRFLDEELSLAYSIRGIGGNFGRDASTFEKAIANDLEMAEMFCPSPKCVTLVKMSKSNKVYVPDSEGNQGFKNMLASYELLHGNMLGVLVRNGENLNMCWLSEDRFEAVKDDLFWTGADKAVPYEGKELKDYEIEREEVRVKGEFASRYIIFSILQGVLDNTDFINIPEKSLMKGLAGQCKYIVLSAASGWLTDSRYGSLADILVKYAFYRGEDELCVMADEYLANEPYYKELTNLSLLGIRHKEGDAIYVSHNLSGITPYGFDGSLRTKRDDDRSNGMNNRAHDVTIREGLHRLNLVCQEGGYSWHHCKRNFSYPAGGEYVDVYTHRVGFFVSGEKAWSDSGARANFAVYPDEFINLTFLNSDLIKYALVTRNIGRVFHGANYAYVAFCLNEIYKFLQEREEFEEKCLKKIDSSIIMDEELLMDLSEWKLEKDVHNFSEYRGKQFLAWRGKKNRRK